MSFRDIQIELRYRSGEHLFPRDFLVPVLKETVIYKRAVGFFSSTAFIELSTGLFEMAKKGGKIQLIASPRLSDEDIEAIRFGYKTRDLAILEALELSITDPLDEFESERLNLIATLVASGMLEIKIAFMEEDTYKNLYHEKIAVFKDADGNTVSFTGSANESANAYYDNFESIYVFCDWKDETHKSYVKIAEHDFDEMWENHTQKIRVIPFPKIVQQKLNRFRRSEIDYETDEKQFHYNAFLEQNQPFRIPSNVTLRDYQNKAVSGWVDQGFRGVFDMCTGAGKSYTALACMVDLAARVDYNLAVFIVCPQIHLVGQWEEDAINWGPLPIIAHSQSPERNWKETLKKAYIRFRNKGTPFVCITTNDTFTGDYIPSIISRFDESHNVLLIIDEAHNFGAERLSSLLPNNIRFRIALSATIERYGDERGTKALYAYFGEKCISYDVEQAIEDGALTKYRYYPHPVYLEKDELEEYKRISFQLRKYYITENGRVKISKEGEQLLFKRARILAAARRKIPLLLSMLESYKDEKHILVYCGATQVEESDDGSLIRQIDEVTHRIQAELSMQVTRFTAEESLKERQNIKYFFSEGLYQVVTAIKCLDEGVNIPAIKTAFIMASTRNPREFIQRRGRLLRRFEGKEYAEIYDFITLPRDLNDVEYGNFEQDKNIIVGEMRRIQEFGRLSDNPAHANSMIERIMSAYGVYFDLDNVESEESNYE